MNEAKIKHFAYVDALRGLAFFMVLGIHCVDASMYSFHLIPEIHSKLFGIGRMGVQLFYLVSAYTLLSSSMQRRSLETYPGVYFFIRRFFRIAPLFWLAIIAYSSLDQVKYFNQNAWAPSGVGYGQVVATFLFIQGWWPTSINSVVPGGWSVGVEMSFYLILPLLCRWITTLTLSLWGGLITLLGGIIVNWLIIHMYGHLWQGAFANAFSTFHFFWLPSQLPVFILGFIL